MDNCIFCKIVSGEIPCAKIWEDENYLAFLDINPNTKGMALVITKEHFDSYLFDMPEDMQAKFLTAANKVSRMLEKYFKISRVALVMEGMGINHAHLKLYPLHGVTDKFVEMWASEKKFFDKYEGYISTQLGPQADMAELNKLAEEIQL
ncbi:MAG: HIT domain-containing protein [Candidatus Parcubacteria bacterium]|nr:HIT domain-containing protein [Candidatus Parcubacteria bacterium]